VVLCTVKTSCPHASSPNKLKQMCKFYLNPWEMSAQRHMPGNAGVRISCFSHLGSRILAFQWIIRFATVQFLKTDDGTDKLFHLYIQWNLADSMSERKISLKVVCVDMRNASLVVVGFCILQDEHAPQALHKRTTHAWNNPSVNSDGVATLARARGWQIAAPRFARPIRGS
jgi:hypothetical protein